MTTYIRSGFKRRFRYKPYNVANCFSPADWRRAHLDTAPFEKDIRAAMS